MGIRKYKPTTAGRRAGSVSDFAEITDRKKKPEKTLLLPHPKKGGRNFHGYVCTRFRGGGHKRMYRIVDFKRSKDNVWATVQSKNAKSASSKNLDLPCWWRNALRSGTSIGPGSPSSWKLTWKKYSGWWRCFIARQIEPRSV